MSFRQGAEALADFFFPVSYDTYYARPLIPPEAARRCVEHLFEYPPQARIGTESPWFALLRPTVCTESGTGSPPPETTRPLGGFLPP